MASRPHGPNPAWLAAAAAAAFAFYAALAPPVMGEGDAAEFTLTLATCGVPHPTGYPLYTLLGHLFVRALHGVGLSWARAAALWSAAGAAAALYLLGMLTLRFMTTRSGAAGPARFLAVTGAMLLLAANPLFVRSATQAEVYTWHLAWVAAACLAALRIHRALKGGRPAASSRPGRASFGWGLLMGAGLAHHLTAVFFAVPLSALLLVDAVRARRLGPGTIAAAIAGSLAGLCAYVFVWWRAGHPAAFQWPLLEPTWPSFLEHIRGGVYNAYLGRFRPSTGESPLLRGGLYPVLLAGGAALAWSALRARASTAFGYGVALIAAAASQFLFVRVYGVPDPGVYLLAALVPALAALGVCAAEFPVRLASPAAAPAILAAAAVICAVVWLPPEFKHRGAILDVDQGVREAFRALPVRRGIVLWQSDSYVRLKALQQLEGEQPNLYVDNPAMFTWELPRRAFQRRFGLDPLAGLDLRSDEDLAAVPQNIARQTSEPVVDFGLWWSGQGGIVSVGHGTSRP